MSFVQIGSRMTACCFVLAITLSVPLIAEAQQNSNPADSISANTLNVMSIALGGGGGGRGGGGRGGGGREGGAARGGGARSGGGARMNRASGGGARFSLGSHSPRGLRSSLGNRPSGGVSHIQPQPGSRNIQAQRPQVGNRSDNQSIRTQPSQPIARQGQRPNIERQPASSRLNTGSGQRPNQLPQAPGNITNRPNQPRGFNQIHASRSVNVEGYDGGWGYQGEDYPWGLGAVAGIAGFTLGSVRNSLPTNSQPVVIQGQPYYESSGMYFSPSGNGNYTVVPPPEGAIENQLPSGAKPVNINGITLYEVQGVYYQPTIQNGKQAYTVVAP